MTNNRPSALAQACIAFEKSLQEAAVRLVAAHPEYRIYPTDAEDTAFQDACIQLASLTGQEAYLVDYFFRGDGRDIPAPTTTDTFLSAAVEEFDDAIHLAYLAAMDASALGWGLAELAAAGTELGTPRTDGLDRIEALRLEWRAKWMFWDHVEIATMRACSACARYLGKAGAGLLRRAFTSLLRSGIDSSARQLRTSELSPRAGDL